MGCAGRSLASFDGECDLVSFGRRVRLHATATEEDALALLDDAAGPVTLIVDVDNTLVRQGARPDEFVAMVNRGLDRFGAHPMVARLIALSNGPPRGVPRIIGRGNKPWTSRRRLGLNRGDRVWVLGDQVLTDGLLAWRLQAPFLNLVVSDQEPLRQARMRRYGRWLIPLLFDHEVT